MTYWKFAAAFAFAGLAVIHYVKHAPLWWVVLMLAAANFVLAVVYQRRRPPLG